MKTTLQGIRLCRGLYDLLGPPVATLVVHPLLADIAYISFKPAESLVRFVLVLLLHDHKQLVAGIYSDRDIRDAAIEFDITTRAF